MPERKKPKIRRVDKYKPPFKLNNFPSSFGKKLGREIVYLLASKSKAVLEGSEWEEIFALCINADWQPSNIGLDDVVKHQTAWGAKTVKSNNPKSQKTVRLISGRNSPTYSYRQSKISDVDPDKIGAMVLEIWNERVAEVSQNFKELRTVVLIKSNDLSQVVVYEYETQPFNTVQYFWKWNKNNNLEGREKTSEIHRFTWQPHGSQFTIIEEVPKSSLLLEIQKPNKLDKKIILDSIGFEESWIKISKTAD